MAIYQQKRKVKFIEWLDGFKKNPYGKKFKSGPAYLNYMALIEKDLKMKPGEIYSIGKLEELKKLEASLRKRKSFQDRAVRQQYNLMSALHVYQNLIDTLSSNVFKAKSK